MEPTLVAGQRVLVNRVGYRIGDPQIGDVVVFHPPAGAENGKKCGARQTRNGATDSDPATYSTEQACPLPTDQRSDTNFIKRIVAGPGDRLYVENGHPVVNGKVASEDFIRSCGGGGACSLPEEITIPPDHFFMMGDNRGASDDSRFWGPVPRDWIIGEAFVTYWPPNRLGVL